MRAGGKAAFAVAVVMIVAGCTSGSADTAPTETAPPAAPPAAPTIESGSIEGVIVDEEAQPIVGATAAIVEANVNTKSDETGKFVINDLPEGKYKLFLEKLGYESMARLVEVKVGEVTPLTATMRALSSVPEALVVMTPFEGFIQCSTNPYYAVNPCEAALGPNKDKFEFELLNGTLKEGVFEMTWTPTSGVSGQTMELDICLPQPDVAKSKVLCYDTGYYRYKTGGPGVSLRLTDMPYKQHKKFVAGGGAGFMEPDVLYQHKFTIFVTMCYFESCADEYTALPPTT